MYTWTELLDDIKVRAAMPTSQATYTEPRLLSLANSSLRSYILPKILKTREAFYEFDVDFAINSSGIYDIPSRALGGTIVNMSLVDTLDAHSGRRADINWIMDDQLSNYDRTDYGNVGAYVKRNQLYLVPKDGSGFAYLRVAIFLRPGAIVANTSAAQISSITTGTKTIEFSSHPTAWSNSNLFDIVQADPHFDSLAIDQPITTLTATSAIFTNELPSRLRVGDWFCLKNETPVIQVPVEWNAALAQHTANTILRAQGDKAAYKDGLEALQALTEDATIVIEPRIKQEGRKIVNRNGILRSQGRW